jgi:hypothetical protein
MTVGLNLKSMVASLPASPATSALRFRYGRLSLQTLPRERLLAFGDRSSPQDPASGWPRSGAPKSAALTEPERQARILHGV